MNRRQRVVASLLAMIALLFAQAVISAHACAFPGQRPAVEFAYAHECCNEDGGTAGEAVVDVVCVEHCQYGKATFDGGQPASGIVTSPGAALRVEVPDVAGSAELRHEWFQAVPAPSPPAAILFGVLRI
jgi:hypothetical protein